MRLDPYLDTQIPIILIFRAVPDSVKEWLSRRNEANRLSGHQLLLPLAPGENETELGWPNIAIITGHQRKTTAHTYGTALTGWLTAEKGSRLKWADWSENDRGLEVNDLVGLEAREVERVLMSSLDAHNCVLQRQGYHVATSAAHTKKLYRLAPMLEDQVIVDLLAFALLQKVEALAPQILVAWAQTGNLLAGHLGAL